MEEGTVGRIAEHLTANVAAEEPSDVRGGIKFRFTKALEWMTEPEPGAPLWLRDKHPKAGWLTVDEAGGFVYTAEAEITTPDQHDPDVALHVESRPLSSGVWTVGLSSDFGRIKPSRAGVRTHWSFRHQGEEVLTLDGARILSAGGSEVDEIDDAEGFARLLASRVGWHLERQAEA